jgi:hypothetical protein
MRTNMRFTYIITFIIFIFAPTLTCADNLRGHLLKVQGNVQIINDKGEIRNIKEANTPVQELDTVVTKGGSKAVVKFDNGSLSVLREKSSLKIEKSNLLSHLGGKIYFTFKKLFGKQRKTRKVRFRQATIGIRGTTFIVTDDESGAGVALEEGSLDIESPGPSYEIHRKKEMSEFEAFKQQAMDQQKAMQDEFADYKKQTMKEFVEYKKSFTLEPNKVIRFDGNRVDESEIGEEVKAEFDDFEKIAGELLVEFRQKSKEHREKQEKSIFDE